MTEIIEGEAVEVERALTVMQQPGQMIVASSEKPAAMIAVATALADALKNIVERQHLYSEIKRWDKKLNKEVIKKYPQVEAWQTIGRLDNVVAREADRPVKNEDGSWEAFVELVRLSDGMVIGNGSAIAGDPKDEPWNSRADYQKRSMAVTRATSRAFRQQYSWIMALAGYEPTPADEMPHEDPAPPMRPPLERRAEGLIGKVKAGSNPVDLQLRETTTGPVYGFKLVAGNRGFQCVAEGDLANTLAVAVPLLAEGETVTVFGRVEDVPWKKDGRDMPPYSRVHLERVQGPEWTIPAGPDEEKEFAHAGNDAAGHEHWGLDR